MTAARTFGAHFLATGGLGTREMDDKPHNKLIASVKEWFQFLTIVGTIVTCTWFVATSYKDDLATVTNSIRDSNNNRQDFERFVINSLIEIVELQNSPNLTKQQKKEKSDRLLTTLKQKPIGQGKDKKDYMTGAGGPPN